MWRLVLSASLAVGLVRCGLVQASRRVTLAVWGRVTLAVWGRVPLAVPRWTTTGLLAVAEKCREARGFQRSVLRALGWAVEGKADWGSVGKVPMPDETTMVAAAKETCLQGHRATGRWKPVGWGGLIRTCEGWQWKGYASSCSAQTCMHACSTISSGWTETPHNTVQAHSCVPARPRRNSNAGCASLAAGELSRRSCGICATYTCTQLLQLRCSPWLTALAPPRANTCSASVIKKTLLQAAQKALCQQCTHCHL